MRQPRERLRLAHEPRRTAARRAARLGLQQLDRELAIELGIVRAIDDAHAAFAESIEHDVAAHERAALEVLGRRGLRRARRGRPLAPGRLRRLVALAHAGYDK